MSDQIGSVLRIVESLADAVQTMQGGQDKLIDGLGRLDADVRQIAERVDTLDGDVRRIAEGQDKLRGDLMARMDRLQDGQQQVRDELAVNYAADEQIGRRLDNGDDVTRGLRGQVNVMVRMVRNMEARLRTLEEDKDQGPSRGM